MSLALGLLLSACGGSNHNDDRSVVPTPAPTPTPVPTPAPTVANTVVAYPSETAELRLYAGQSRQITLNFKTSDGASATELALALPDGGLPAGWSIGSNRKRCELVDVDNLCQIALTYAPAVAQQSSVVTFPYTYRDNKGNARTGTTAIAYVAMPFNAATATLTPAGPVRGVVGKAVSVILGFGTNDGSPATELHVENDPAALPAGWTSAGGLDCANFGAGSPCQLTLNYTPPSAAPASALAISYRYKDSSGKQQAAIASVDYSAVAPNTVAASLDPPGVVRARTNASQQVTLTFAPSDSSHASGLRLVTDVSKLPADWTVKASTLPCAKVDSSGSCTVTLVYTPGSNQPAGKLDVDYAYTDAVGRELTGKTTVSYASHDYQAYVGDFGGVENGALVGGVRQCEFDSARKLTNCVKADETWPRFAVNNVVVHGARAYFGSYTNARSGVPGRTVTSCRIDEDGALVDCIDSGPVFDQLSNLEVNQLGAFVVAVPSNVPPISHLTRCDLNSDGQLDSNRCRSFDYKTFDGTIPTAMTSEGDRIYVSGSNFSTVQNLYSCALADDGLKCSTFALGAPQQIVQRMSRGQAGDQAYLYLATASRSDPQKAPGAIVKCALDADALVTACAELALPKGLKPTDLTRISDIRIAGPTAYLVTGQTDDTRKVYQCLVEQKTGDLAECSSAGDVEGLANSSIAVR